MAAPDSRLTITLTDEAGREIEGWVTRLEAAAVRMKTAAAKPTRFVLSFGPHDEEDFLLALNGWKWQRVCRDFDRILRDRLKYLERDNRTAGLISAREILRHEIAEAGLSLDD